MIALIIFGTRGVTGVMATGQFHCPACGQVRSYEHKRARQFFSLYWIPILPIRTLGEWIQCKECQGEFKTEVLSYSPDAPNQPS